MEEVVGRTTALGGCVLYKNDWNEMGWYNHQRQLKLQDVKRENRSTKLILDTEINAHYENAQKIRKKEKKWLGMSWYVFTCHLSIYFSNSASPLTEIHILILREYNSILLIYISYINRIIQDSET